MNCLKPDRLRLLSMELLDSTAAEAARGHLRECEKCRAAAEQFKRESESIGAAHAAFSLNHDLEREQLMARLSLEPACNWPAPEREDCRGGFLMRLNNPYGRGAAGLLAAAACIALVFTIFSEGESKAFGRVIQRLREAQSISCRVQMTMHAAVIMPAENNKMRMEKQEPFVFDEELYISAEHGIRRETYLKDEHISTAWVMPDEKVFYVHHPRKQYQVYDPAAEANREVTDGLRDLLSERIVPDLHMGKLSDPAHMIEALRELTAEADADLGWKTFDGVEAYGFEISGAKAGFGPPLFDDIPENKVRLWIDPENVRPVRIEVHFVTKIAEVAMTGMSARFVMDSVYNDFELDGPLAAELFEPNIPEAFTPIDELAMLPGDLTEEAFIDALGIFSDLTGRYPPSMNIYNVMYEVSFVIGSVQSKRLIAEGRGEDTSGMPAIDEVGKKLQGFLYFRKLETEGAAPEYFGEATKPADADRVLVQWTLPDGATRVIYGDLSVETVP